MARLIESSLARITKHLHNHAVGIITAFRDTDEYGKKYTTQQKRQRNTSLLANLRMRGYWVTPVEGIFIENWGRPDEQKVKEESFFVVNPKGGDDDGQLERDLIELANRYDQDSCLSKPFGKEAHLVGTSHRDGLWLSYGARSGIGDKLLAGVESQIMTRVRNRPFTFIKPPVDKDEEREVRELADMDWREIALNEAASSTASEIVREKPRHRFDAKKLTADDDYSTIMAAFRILIDLWKKNDKVMQEIWEARLGAIINAVADDLNLAAEDIYDYCSALIRREYGEA